MSALLDALAGWGPSVLAAGTAALALALVVAAFGLGVAHGTASAVAYAGTAGVAILLASLAFQALRARDA